MVCASPSHAVAPTTFEELGVSPETGGTCRPLCSRKVVQRVRHCEERAARGSVASAPRRKLERDDVVDRRAAPSQKWVVGRLFLEVATFELRNQRTLNTEESHLVSARTTLAVDADFVNILDDARFLPSNSIDSTRI